MLGNRARSDRWPAMRSAAVACLAVLAAAGLTGCYARARAATSIQIATAYVPQPAIPGQTAAMISALMRRSPGRSTNTPRMSRAREPITNGAKTPRSSLRKRMPIRRLRRNSPNT